MTEAAMVRLREVLADLGLPADAVDDDTLRAGAAALEGAAFFVSHGLTPAATRGEEVRARSMYPELAATIDRWGRDNLAPGVEMGFGPEPRGDVRVVLRSGRADGRIYTCSVLIPGDPRCHGPAEYVGRVLEGAARQVGRAMVLRETAAIGRIP